MDPTEHLLYHMKKSCIFISHLLLIFISHLPFTLILFPPISSPMQMYDNCSLCNQRLQQLVLNENRATMWLAEPTQISSLVITGPLELISPQILSVLVKTCDSSPLFFQPPRNLFLQLQRITR